MPLVFSSQLGAVVIAPGVGASSFRGASSQFLLELFSDTPPIRSAHSVRRFYDAGEGLRLAHNSCRCRLRRNGLSRVALSFSRAGVWPVGFCDHQLCRFRGLSHPGRLVSGVAVDLLLGRHHCAALWRGTGLPWLILFHEIVDGSWFHFESNYPVRHFSLLVMSLTSFSAATIVALMDLPTLGADNANHPARP